MNSLIFIAFAGLFKAVMDTLNFHFYRSVFAIFPHKWWQWFNPEQSWKNKYQWSDNKMIKWLLCNPLCWITDAWHFFSMFRIFSYVMAVVLYQPLFYWWIDFLLLWVVHSIIFHIFFTYILKK